MGQLFTFTGYAESGVMTVIRRFCKVHPEAVIIKSTTTKAPTSSDIPGMYEYVTELAFTTLEWLGKLSWGILYRGWRDDSARYGTTRKALADIDKVIATEGAIGIMHLSPEGVEKLREYLVAKKCEDAHVPIFLSPPSEQIHRTRLMSRGASPLAITRALHKGAEWKALAEKAKNEGKVPYHFIPNSSSVKRTIRAVRQFLV